MNEDTQQLIASNLTVAYFQFLAINASSANFGIPVRTPEADQQIVFEVYQGFLAKLNAERKDTPA